MFEAPQIEEECNIGSNSLCYYMSRSDVLGDTICILMGDTNTNLIMNRPLTGGTMPQRALLVTHTFSLTRTSTLCVHVLSMRCGLPSLSPKTGI